MMEAKWNGNEVAYYNGVVYTANRSMPTAQAFVVRDGRFLAVGTNDIVDGCPNTVDLKGCCVIPGLVDSHCHLLAGVQRAALNIMDLSPETKPQELGDRLLAAMEEQNASDDDVIAAMGISLSQGEFSAADIDSAISDRPVAVFTDDGHALLLNSKAMEALGVDKNTKDPGEQSFFKRDADGNATGLVIEIAAMSMCKDLFTDESEVDPSEILRELYRQYAAYGYTTVFEAMSGDDEDCALVEALAAVTNEEENPGLRVSTSFCYRGEDTLGAEAALSVMKNLRERLSGPYLLCNTLKLILDGTVEEHTALLSEPYADEPDNSGNLMLSVEEMEKMAALAAGDGFGIHVLVIGDKAASIALDAPTDWGPFREQRRLRMTSSTARMRSERLPRREIFFSRQPPIGSRRMTSPSAAWVKRDTKCSSQRQR